MTPMPAYPRTPSSIPPSHLPSPPTVATPLEYLMPRRLTYFTHTEVESSRPRKYKQNAHRTGVRERQVEEGTLHYLPAIIIDVIYYGL